MKKSKRKKEKTAQFEADKAIDAQVTQGLEIKSLVR
jgi:hypothetical protein